MLTTFRSSGNATATGKNTTPKATQATTTTTKEGQGSKTGAQFPTSASATASPSPDAASSDFTMASSAVTLLFGAVAALLYLQ